MSKSEDLHSCGADGEGHQARLLGHRGCGSQEPHLLSGAWRDETHRKAQEKKEHISEHQPAARSLGL